VTRLTLRSSFSLYKKPHFILSEIKINNSNIIQTPTLIINHFNIAHPSSFNLTLIIRRTAITRWARNITAAGSSLQDVQQLARHSSLQMTQKYIEVSEGTMKRVVG
jgi:integrase